MNKRRQELSRNELADRLETGINSVQSYIPWIFGGIAVVVVASLGWGLYSSAANKKAAKAWTDYYFGLGTGEADTFLDLAEEHTNTRAGDWARQTAGSGYLERGLGSIYFDRDEAERLLELALEQFTALEDNADPQLRAKALLGAAQANESLGNVDDAIAYYEKLAKSATQARVMASANERIAFLQSTSGKEFYAWFDKLDRKPDTQITLPDDLSTPPTGLGGIEFSTPETTPEDAPVDTSTLPPAPDLSAPEDPATDAPAVNLPTPNLELDSPTEGAAPDLPSGDATGDK